MWVTSLTRCFTDCWPPPDPHTLSIRFPPFVTLSNTVARSRAALEREIQILVKFHNKSLEDICSINTLTPTILLWPKWSYLWEKVRFSNSIGPSRWRRQQENPSCALFLPPLRFRLCCALNREQSCNGSVSVSSVQNLKQSHRKEFNSFFCREELGSNKNAG